MTLEHIRNILTTILLYTDSGIPGFLLSALYIAGLWGMFRKSGIDSRWALVPCVKELKLGQAAGLEREGRVAAVARGLAILAAIVSEILQMLMENAGEQEAAKLDNQLLFLEIIVVVVNLVLVIYLVRIEMGLCEVYNQKKYWLWLWIPLEGLAAMIWGWMKEFQPQWKPEEMHTDAAGFFSGSKAAVLDQGLTINLEERTATEFFKKKYLLRDIHMYIQPGHMVLLLGGSGAGKTTYLNAVNGYEKAKAEVVLNGENLYTHYKQMQYDIGFVPQLDLMRGSDSVYRTLMDAAALRLPRDFTKAERQARVEEVMNIFGLTPVKNNLVVKLSGGQRKRLSIAMEFISNPTLFILDEPDSGLDGVMARELFLQLRQIADHGKIIIVITHTPDRVIDLFDDVIVLAKDSNRTGRLAYFGPIQEAREFFGKEKMEEIVKSVNRQEEGGEGRADEFIMRYAEVQHV